MDAGQLSGRRAQAAAVDGLLLLNKPAGMTSNQALQKVKRLLQARKAGHTGSLDPSATGMLPLCFGEATKICAYLLEAAKSYRVTAKLGESTDTLDADGKVIAEAPVPALSSAEWEAHLSGFLGDSLQVPPMYSALKQNGKRLYELARKGQVVERKARPITITALDLLEVAGSRLVFRVACSKGTYVRTLVEDIAKAAGTVAHTRHLHRETVGPFLAEDMLDMTAAEQAAADGPEGLRRRLLSADRALPAWPSCRVKGGQVEDFCGGQIVTCDNTEQGMTKVYADAGEFLGIGTLIGDGRVAPKRVFRRSPGVQ